MSLLVQLSRWLSGKHVGEAQPVFKAWVRRGHLERHYRNLPDEDVYSYVPGTQGPNAVWYGEWVPDEDYMEVPNVIHASGDGDFGQNGVEQCAITIDNIVMKEETGVAGLFHMVKRGYMSPLRGKKGYRGQRIGNVNEWHDTWKDKATQIMCCAGYGEAYFPLFCGLIDDVDLTATPDTIEVTARNMGVFLSDQKAFMDAKILWARDPITFCDRQLADNLTNVAGPVRAKDDDGGHPARFATDSEDNGDDSDETAWLSAAYGDKDGMTWLELTLPAGRYENFEIFPAFGGLKMYTSLHTTNSNVPGGGSARHTNGEHVGEGWVTNGSGHVPGTDIPYIGHAGTLKEKVATYRIAAPHGGGYLVGDGSRLRIWFTQLARTQGQKQFVYKAGVRNIKVFNRVKKDEALKNHWILVDDVSDIVKTVLQWAGLTDWEVESVGVRLSDKLVFDRQAFLIDIINRIAEMTSYIFYVRPPDEFDSTDLSKDNPVNQSMGVAVFRQNNAMKSRPLDKVYTVRDTQLLTNIQASFSSAPLAQSIRVRGRAVQKGKRAIQDRNLKAHALGADRTKRIQWSYRPVWARKANSRFAALRRPVVHYDEQIATVYEAKVACLYIAFREALESAKAQIEIPMWPPIYLDHQTVLYDETTGINTRLWVASRGWEYQGGSQKALKMTLAGSLLDTDDIQETRKELQRLLANHGWDPAPIARGPWTEIHKF